MLFDQFVNKILKENIISSVPSFQKQEEKQKVVPKKIEDIGSYQKTPQETNNNDDENKNENEITASPNESDDSSKAIQGLANAIQQGNKQQEEFYKKMIAVITAQKPQQNTTNLTQNPTSTTNPQEVISNLTKIGTYKA